MIRPNPKPQIQAEREDLPGNGVVQEYVPPVTIKTYTKTRTTTTDKPQSTTKPTIPKWTSTISSTTSASLPTTPTTTTKIPVEKTGEKIF